MIDIALLGSPELRRSGESIDALLVQPRRLALLAYLAAANGAFHRRDRLLLLFWGDQPESRARGSLRQALYFIRRTLGDDVLLTRGDDEVGLDPAAVSVDVREFERAIAEGRLDDAAALYRGDFLADFNIDDAAEFERWAAERRRELRRSIVAASWKLADTALAERSGARATSWARRAVELADYAEPDARRAMRIVAATGDRSAALFIYETLRERMATDLEMAPDAATTALVAELRSARSAATVADAPVAGPPVERLSGEAPVVMPAAELAPPRARWPLVATGVAAFVVAGIALWFGRSAGAGADSAAASRVAVFPFTVRSRSAGTGYLREGAATLLGLALDGAGRLRIVDPNAVLSASPTSLDVSAGRRIATTLGAGRFVLGEIEQSGDRLNVAATLYDASGGIRGRATAVGAEGAVFDLVDSLARRLAVTTMTDSTVRLAGVAATSTRSLAAFKSFLAGETALRAGHYRDAVAGLHDAVAADSAFGLAWYRLALAVEWTEGEISSDSAAALAEHFASRLPDRDRKLLAARRAFVRRDGAEGERLAREVLATYPTDADAWLQLAEVRFHLGPDVGRNIDDARAAFLSVLHYRPNDLSARVHLTRIAARDRDLPHLDEWSGRDTWLADASEVGTFELAAMRAVMLGDQSARDTLASAARRATERTVLSTVWRLQIYSGDPDAAARIAAMRPGEASESRASEITGEIARGRLASPHSGAAELAQHAATVALMLSMPSAPALPAVARRAHDELASVPALHASGQVAIAARMLEARYPDLPALHEPSAEPRTATAIAGALRLVTSDPVRALAMIVPAQLDDSTMRDAVLYDLVASIRAEGLHRLKKDDDALAWLRSIGMNSGGLSAGIALATRRIAEVESARGNTDAAAKARAEFVRMWQSSDPDFRPLVDAARR